MMKILIADDETPIREWIQYSIERSANSKFEIAAIAENGDEAYKAAVEKQVDIVITDIKMPGMDGLSLIKALRKELPYAAFIILTNYAEFSYAQEAVAYGARKYLLKSEMRGRDIIDALEEIENQNRALLAGHEDNCYSTGYLDVFTCFQHRDDENFIRDFWIRHHLNEDEYHLVAAVYSRDSLEEKEVIDHFIEEQNIRILRPILQGNNIYLVIQAEQEYELERTAKRFWQEWDAQGRGVVVSTCPVKENGRIMEALEMAEALLGYGFFCENGYYTESDMNHRPAIDRVAIKKEYSKILNRILYENMDIISEEISQWFDMLRNPALNDVEWARDICIRFSLGMEELLQERRPECRDEKKISKTWLFRDYEDYCMEQLKALYSEKQFRYSPSIREAVSYIHRNYGKQDLSLKEVAASVYRSSEYLSRLFKAETGENFGTYLMKYRLDKAKELLVHTDMKIYEIADEVGYTTASYFSKVYRDYTGVSPEMTRQQNSERISKK